MPRRTEQALNWSMDEQNQQKELNACFDLLGSQNFLFTVCISAKPQAKQPELRDTDRLPKDQVCSAPNLKQIATRK